MSTYRFSTADTPQREFAIARLQIDQPLQWLQRGWSDLRAAPAISLAYGAFVASIVALFSYLTFVADRFYLVPGMFGGFLIIAPLLSVGLMAVAKHLEQPTSHDTRPILRILGANRPSIAMMGVFLIFVFLNWIMLSNLLFGALFSQVFPTYEQIQPLPVMFGESFIFVVAYGGIALLLAAVLFRMTALSLPMLVDHRVDALNAVFASWRAVGENWRPMSLWAVLIVLLVGIGFITYFAGLIIVVPWLAYSSWHAYRDTLMQQSP